LKPADQPLGDELVFQAGDIGTDVQSSTTQGSSCQCPCSAGVADRILVSWATTGRSIQQLDTPLRHQDGTRAARWVADLILSPEGFFFW
jgi:hypothetical protein